MSLLLDIIQENHANYSVALGSCIKTTNFSINNIKFQIVRTVQFISAPKQKSVEDGITDQDYFLNIVSIAKEKLQCCFDYFKQGIKATHFPNVCLNVTNFKAQYNI